MSDIARAITAPEDMASASPCPAPLRTSPYRHLRLPALAFLLSRLWAILFVYIGHTQHGYLSPVIGGWEGVKNWWLNPWTTFDSKHFIDIALHGYNSQNAAFFPLYPFLLKLAGNDPVRMALWGIFLSNAAFFGALILFYRLTEQEYSSQVAQRATWLLAFFPTTAYFSAVYTDAIFLLFFVSCFWCVRNKRWGWVALWAALAALTRNLGALIFLALAYEWWQARRTEKTRDKAPVWALAAVLAPLLALVAAQGYVALQVGQVLSGVTSQTEYFRAPTWPWLPVWLDIKATLDGHGVILWLHLLTTISAFVFLWRHRKTVRASYAVMIAGLMLMHLTLGHTIVPYTLPSARYLSTMFPYIQLLALETALFSSPRLRLILFTICWLSLAAMISFEFGRKGFVG